MNHFKYQDGRLCCERVPLRRIAEAVGTPTYVYSYETLARHYRVFDEALATRRHLICYAMKANSNLAILRALVALGAGVDTVSRGEIERALKAGASPQKIVFSGVGKRADEIAYALDAGILAFNVESIPELDLINEVAAGRGRRAPVSLRINPDVDAETHPYISTGLRKNKFGIPVSQAEAAFARAQSLPHIEVIGLDCHIGSQLLKTAPFRDAILRLGELAQKLTRKGIALRYLDVGGGLGIPYDQETPPTPADYARAIDEAMQSFAGLDLTLICEPGRSLVGNAGLLLTRTLYVKDGEEKSFVIIDAAMNDLIRPSFYDAYHAIWPEEERQGDPYVADVVGPICETGDFLARDRRLSFRPNSGDLLAVLSAGAYGFSMSSNYNSRPRAAEVLVRDERFAVVRKRERLEDLIQGEEIPDFI
jgi:diaminopimelate decarboxylase